MNSSDMILSSLSLHLSRLRNTAQAIPMISGNTTPLIHMCALRFDRRCVGRLPKLQCAEPNGMSWAILNRPWQFGHCGVFAAIGHPHCGHLYSSCFSSACSFSSVMPWRRQKPLEVLIRIWRGPDRRATAEYPNPIDFTRLLRTRGERPCHRRAAEKLDELASTHIRS